MQNQRKSFIILKEYMELVFQTRNDEHNNNIIAQVT